MNTDYRTYDDVAFEMPPRKRIALAAHPTRRDALVAWARRNADPLSLHDLGAPAGLAEDLEVALDLPVRSLGGDDPVVGALTGLVADVAVDVLIVFCDADTPLSSTPSLAELLRRAVEWNVPFACNATTADFLVASPLMLDDYVRDLPELTELVVRPR